MSQTEDMQFVEKKYGSTPYLIANPALAYIRILASACPAKKDDASRKHCYNIWNLAERISSGSRPVSSTSELVQFLADCAGLDRLPSGKCLATLNRMYGAPLQHDDLMKQYESTKTAKTVKPVD